jgi:hypothetical protein
MVSLYQNQDGTSGVHLIGDGTLHRMVLAVEKVRERLKRAATALEAAGIPYAVVGGNAVAAWVSEVDPSAVRNTQDVDILLNRSDLDDAEKALAPAGFVRRVSSGITMFLDGPEARARDAIHVVFAGEKVRPEHSQPAPSLSTVIVGPGHRLLELELLVGMKLTSFRLKDQVHLQDLASVGLIDHAWPVKYPPLLSERLRQILDHPEA